MPSLNCFPNYTVSNQPRIAQMYFDKGEVLQIEDDKKCHEILICADDRTNLIEMLWDGEVVYAISLTSAQILVNRLLY